MIMIMIIINNNHNHRKTMTTVITNSFSASWVVSGKSTPPIVSCRSERLLIVKWQVNDKWQVALHYRRWKRNSSGHPHITGTVPPPPPAQLMCKCIHSHNHQPNPWAGTMFHPSKSSAVGGPISEVPALSLGLVPGTTKVLFYFHSDLWRNAVW